MYKCRQKLNSYVKSAECSRNIAPLLAKRLDYLNLQGFNVVQDTVVLLERLAYMTILHEGENMSLAVLLFHDF